MRSTRILTAASFIADLLADLLVDLEALLKKDQHRYQDLHSPVIGVASALSRAFGAAATSNTLVMTR